MMSRALGEEAVKNASRKHLRAEKDASKVDEIATNMKKNQNSEREEDSGLLEANDDGGASPSNTVFIGNLHPRVAEVHLEKLMQRFGAIRNIKVCFLTGKPRGFAFCEYEDKSSAKQAESLDGRTLFGNKLTVRPAHGGSKQANLLRPPQSNARVDTKKQQQALDLKIQTLKRKLQQK
jgi:RNA recognition motif-containing protein